MSESKLCDSKWGTIDSLDLRKGALMDVKFLNGLKS